MIASPQRSRGYSLWYNLSLVKIDPRLLRFDCDLTGGWGPGSIGAGAISTTDVSVDRPGFHGRTPDERPSQGIGVTVVSRSATHLTRSAEREKRGPREVRDPEADGRCGGTLQVLALPLDHDQVSLVGVEHHQPDDRLIVIERLVNSVMRPLKSSSVVTLRRPPSSLGLVASTLGRCYRSADTSIPCPPAG